MADGHLFENRYISPYFSEKSSDFHEILYTAADFKLDERHVIKIGKVALDRLRVRQKVFLVLLPLPQPARQRLWDRSSICLRVCHWAYQLEDTDFGPVFHLPHQCTIEDFRILLAFLTICHQPIFFYTKLGDSNSGLVHRCCPSVLLSVAKIQKCNFLKSSVSRLIGRSLHDGQLTKWLANCASCNATPS